MLGLVTLTRTLLSNYCAVLFQVQQLSKLEVEDLLRKGAYGALMDEEDEGSKFCEEDIDQILQRRTQTITIQSEGKGSTFAKVHTSIYTAINVWSLWYFVYVFESSLWCLPRWHAFDQKYTKTVILWNIYIIQKYSFLFEYILKCNLFLWSKLNFQHNFSCLQCHMIFRNHSNMLNCCSKYFLLLSCTAPI